MSKIVIAGGGLCGALAGAYLASNGYEIEVLERRTDLRLGTAETGRSINLALSARGIKALGLIGLDEELKQISIPMPVRALHQKDGTIYYVPYSGRSGEYINSISRTGLNALLLEKLSEFKNVKISFEAACTQVDFKNKFVGYSSNGGHHSTSYDFLMGTDGAASVVRKNLYEQPFFSHTLQQDFLDYGYKELHIDPLKDGGFAIEKNAL
ncbi:MAG: FAD-dependent monooxygenase, partial [Saprospiraceae bacterium]